MGFADLHIHTTYSLDAVSSVSGVLKYAAHHALLDVIAITDHDRIEGALEALDLAPSYGIEIIPGVEVSSAEGHILALFVYKAVPAGLSIEQTVLKVMELGGICIIPHPNMRSRIGVSPLAIQRALQNEEVKKGLLGVELYNAGFAGVKRDVAAIHLAGQLPIAKLGCSDAHVDWMIGQGATHFPGHNAQDLRQALENRQTSAIGMRRMSLREFTFLYVPRLALRYAGRGYWNAAPSEPLQVAWLGVRRRHLRNRLASTSPYQS